jgi:Ca2+-binding RTX toxin-like protein
VWIAGGNGTATSITGPADAALLGITGTVSLAGTFAAGQLSVGNASATGVLSLATGADVQAASCSVAGGIALSGGTLSVAGSIDLGSTGAAGVLLASGNAVVQAGAVILGGAGSTIATSAGGEIDIGGDPQGEAAGTLLVDANGMLTGAGSVQPGGPTLDDGIIIASGGTLSLGAVSGSGSLLVGLGATLALQGSVGSGMSVDFAGAGTLQLSQSAQSSAPVLADFAPGDTVLLAGISADTAAYTQTGAGIGVVQITNAGAPVAELTLLGDASGLAFTVTASPGGGTALTATPEKSSGNGPGGVMTNPTTSTGTTLALNILASSLQGELGYAETELLGTYAANTEVYEWFSANGLAPAENTTRFPAFEVVAPLAQQTGAGAGPGSLITMQAGFDGVLLEGTQNQTLSDGGLGHALLVGNYGLDTVIGTGEGDTLVGAPGTSTVFEGGLPAGAPGSGLGYDVTIIGGGNDTIATGYDAANVTTSDGRSVVYLGAPETESVANSVVLNGADTVVCGGNGGARDNITVSAKAGVGPNLLFGSANSELNITGGNTASIVVGAQGGIIFMQGGNANGSIVWGDGAQDVSYVGHAGSAIIVAGSGQTDVEGGSGPMTVYGGTGEGVFTSAAAGSIIVAGAGATTVQATAGVSIYLSGSGAVSVAGSAGGDAFGGQSTGQDVFQCNAGAETMWGGLGNDTLVAGSGNDLLCSDGGRDVFSFTNGLAGGSDEIVGFNASRDMVQLHGYGAAAPTITYAWGDSYLNLADGTHVVFVGVSDLTASSITTG